MLEELGEGKLTDATEKVVLMKWMKMPQRK